MHLSDKALLVHLGVSQWTARKLDKQASKEVAQANGATGNVGNFNKTLLPTCNTIAAVHQETAIIRKEFYRNVLPWGIEGTFILLDAAIYAEDDLTYIEVVDKPVRAEELREWYLTTLPWADGVRVK